VVQFGANCDWLVDHGLVLFSFWHKADFANAPMISAVESEATGKAPVDVCS